MIRKRASIVLICLALGSVFCDARNTKEEIELNPYKAGGVYFMYDFDTPPLTKAPKGYKEFCISHYGRHGARYLYLESQNLRVVDVWRTLKEEGKLTEYGEDVYRRVMEHFSQTHYREGDLTDKGWDQHTRNGQIIYKSYPAIFQKNPHIYATSTLVPRCIMSMNAFCSGLWRKDAGLDIHQNTSRMELPSLNPHTTENPFRKENSSDDDRYRRKDPWGGKLRDFTVRTVDCNAFVNRLTTDPTYLASLRKPQSFMTDMYNFVLNMQCSDTGVDLMDIFTQDELYALWQVDNYMYWVENGPLATRDRAVVDNMISSIEQDFESDRPVVRLRFGHDSVLLSVLSTLGVNGMNTIPKNADEIKDIWQNYNVPMGATFYLVFYKPAHGNGDILFKAVLNGKEATMPFEAVSGPYYKWTDLKEFCQ